MRSDGTGAQAAGESSAVDTMWILRGGSADRHVGPLREVLRQTDGRSERADLEAVREFGRDVLGRPADSGIHQAVAGAARRLSRLNDEVFNSDR